MQKYIDDSGVENVACAIAKQARTDFIKGGKILYGVFNRIPTYEELIASPHESLSHDETVRWMYDSWRFVRNDPYSMFGMGEESVIQSWMYDAIIEYYKELYLKGAVILFANHISKKDIKENDELIKKTIEEPSVADGFIKARNYIFTLPNGDKTLHEWDVIAYGRRRSLKRGTGRVSIEKTEYSKKISEKRLENIKRTRELFEAGFTPKAIAEELGITVRMARLYLRS